MQKYLSNIIKIKHDINEQRKLMTKEQLKQLDLNADAANIKALKAMVKVGSKLCNTK